MNLKFTTRKILIFLCLGAELSVNAQNTLKFENGGGPSGSGPSATSKTVTIYRGDAGVYSPNTTVTYSFSNQQYPSIEGSSTTPGLVFGGNLNNSGNSPTSIAYYMLMNALGGSANSHYSTNGATPPINIANDYGLELAGYSDALINANGSNKVPTNSKNVYFGDLTLTFNRPVTNPVLHLTGIGGFMGNQGFSMRFELTGSEYSLSRLAGNFAFSVAGPAIYNSSARYTTSTNNSSPSGASGSVLVKGSNIKSLTFKVAMDGDGGGNVWSQTNRVGADGLLMAVSLTTYNINGTVFNDNDNGTPDGIGHGGVTVELLDENNNVVGTATTDSYGNYLFRDVIAGNYRVVITPPAGFENVGSSEGDRDGSTAIALVDRNVTGVDFGINEPPVAADDQKLDQPAGSTVIVSLLENDSAPNGGTLDPEKISLIIPAGATDVTTDPEGRFTGFTVPGEGSWTRGTDGTLTFAPEEGFTGDPTPIQYTVTDEAGLTSEPATVTITYQQAPPDPADDAGEGNRYGDDATVNILENDKLSDGGPATPDNTTITLTTTGLPEGSTVSGNTVVVPGEGTWTYDPATGDLTFSPAEGFRQNPTPLTYTLTENATGQSEDAKVNMNYQSLPVKLVRFTVGEREGAVKLDWATSEEVNFARFEVERSSDGHSFTAIATLTAKGTGSRYSFTDAGIGQGSHYYRLRMVDSDGSVEYSPIVNSVIRNARVQVTVYPNPATDFVTVTGLNGNGTVSLLNLNGIRLKEVAVSGNAVSVDLRETPAGIYFIRVRDNNGIHALYRVLKE